MFSGIITNLGKIIFFEKKKIGIKSDLKNLFLGQSISCSGVCLTVSKKSKDTFYCDLSEETISKTSFSNKKKGDYLNLETSLKVGDEINGHLVFGHVDGITIIKSIKNLEGSRVVEFKTSSRIMGFLTPKCSISIDGISLTVNAVLKNTFKISVIPYTWKKTNFNFCEVGDTFNLEVDMLARYVHRALKNEK